MQPSSVVEFTPSLIASQASPSNSLTESRALLGRERCRAYARGVHRTCRLVDPDECGDEMWEEQVQRTREGKPVNLRNLWFHAQCHLSTGAIPTVDSEVIALRHDDHLDQAVEAEGRDFVDRFLRSLCDRDRQIALLLLAGATMDEIAKVRECAPQYIHQRVCAMRQALARFREKEEGGR